MAARTDVFCLCLVMLVIMLSTSSAKLLLEIEFIYQEQVVYLYLEKTFFTYTDVEFQNYQGKLRCLCCFLLLGDIESCPGPNIQNDLQGLSSMRGIKLIHQNIRGLFGKRDILQTLFTSDKSKFIVTLSETHKTPTNLELFKMPGFQFIHKDRQNCEGGGVTIYLSDNIKWKKEQSWRKKKSNVFGWKLSFLNDQKGQIELFKGFLVGCIYRQPDSSNHLRKNFNKLLNEMLTKVNEVSMETFLLGDININYFTKSNHIEIKDIFISHGLDQIVKAPIRLTKDTKTLIDVILRKNRSHVRYTKVIPLSLSDHDCVACVRKLNHSKEQFRKIECSDYSKYDYKELARDVENYDWSSIYAITNINTACDFMKQALSSIIDRHALLITKRVKGRRCPWLSHEIKTLMSVRDR